MTSAVQRRRGRPPVAGLAERRREEILHAATHVFARAGYPRTDLQDVAAALGVGKGTIYRYFPTKRDLFQAAVDRVMTGMRGEIDAAKAEVADPLDQITAAIRAYLAYFDAHPEFVELLIQERAEFRDRKQPTYFAHREANAGRWREFYQHLMDEERVRRMPVDRIMDVLSSAIYGTMFTNYFAGRKKTLLQQCDDVLDVVFTGILTPSEQASRAAAQHLQSALSSQPKTGDQP